jgi:peptidoglycan hydrolase-like protein with peptidoglycan-binding domain
LEDCAPFAELASGGQVVVTTSYGGKVVLDAPIDNQTSEMTESDLELTKDMRREIQRRLTLIGHETKGVDGSLGKNSRKAIIEWQEENQLLPTGYLNDSQLSALRRDSTEEYDTWKKREASKPKKQRVKLCKRGFAGILYDCRYVWR